MTQTQLIAMHEQACKVARRIMAVKNSDYTGGSAATDALANFKGARSLGVHPITGLLLRMQDKLMRLRSFSEDGGLKVPNESASDACLDLLNYSVLCLALVDEQVTQTKAEANARAEAAAAKAEEKDAEPDEIELEPESKSDPETVEGCAVPPED